jgi:hypothetical protein
MAQMLDPMYLAVCLDLEAQTTKMNALNAALQFHEADERLEKEFSDASFLVCALSYAKARMEED